MQAGENPDPRAHWAIRYFRSGWAFLVPYTLLYFAYAWLKWPVNPLGAGSKEQGAGIFGGGIPLLYSYWVLHAIHALLGVAALRVWWSGYKQSGTAQSPSASRLPSPASRALASALPWIGLALLFWIPGVYLEFPADPWQHYARLNEWSRLELVTQHSSWKKSSYFLGYSLIGHVGQPLTQLKWFDVYYTGCCLLLCWQYYRLARAVGLGEKASLLFVLLNTLTFGNNLFGFYRYYGMSSTVFAQLGAVAVTRIAFEAMRGKRETGCGRPENIDAPTPNRGVIARFSSLRFPVSRLLRFAPALAGALLIAVGNHFQGALIAGAGLAAVVVWRLIEWRRSTVLWLVLAAVVVNVATVRWWPRDPMVDAIYLPHGWMTKWYAFKLFDLSSPSFERAWIIVGATGGFNLLASLWLLRRNHVVAWLTLMPVLLLLLPCFALPFANTLATSTDWESGYITAFHRILFAAPSALALVILCARAGGQRARLPQDAESPTGGHLRRHRYVSTGNFAARYSITFILAPLVTLPASNLAFNRLYNALMVPADDLALESVTRALNRPHLVGTSPAPRFISTGGIAYVAYAISDAHVYRPRKLLLSSPLETMHASVADFRGAVARREAMIAFYPFSRNQYTAESLSARLSGHWNPVQVDLEFVFGEEITRQLIHAGAREVADNDGRLFVSPRVHQPNRADDNMSSK